MMSIFAVLFLFAFVLAFGVLLVNIPPLLSKLFYKLGMKSIRKVEMDPVKYETYECGVPVERTGDTNIPIKYYLTAILFILFDIEIIFMYPWAVSIDGFIENGLGYYTLAAMGVFLLIFIFGLFWEIKSKALEWE